MTNYTAYRCTRCQGTGSHRDSTLLDKVATGGSSRTRCARCKDSAVPGVLLTCLDSVPRNGGERLPEYDR